MGPPGELHQGEAWAGRSMNHLSLEVVGQAGEQGITSNYPGAGYRKYWRDSDGHDGGDGCTTIQLY